MMKEMPVVVQCCRCTGRPELTDDEIRDLIAWLELETVTDEFSKPARSPD
jgi:DNA gyrase inhibitor GyrI